MSENNFFSKYQFADTVFGGIFAIINKLPQQQKI